MGIKVIGRLIVGRGYNRFVSDDAASELDLLARATRAKGGPVKGTYEVMRGVGPGTSTKFGGERLDGL